MCMVKSKGCNCGQCEIMGYRPLEGYGYMIWGVFSYQKCNVTCWQKYPSHSFILLHFFPTSRAHNTMLHSADIFFLLIWPYTYHPEGDSSPSHSPILKVCRQQLFNSHWSIQLPLNCIEKVPFKTYNREVISLAIPEWKGSLERG